MNLVRSRGIVGKPRRGRTFPMCWYCGSRTGKVVRQPDGGMLHEHCEGPAAKDYPNRVTCEGEQVDAKVGWLDQRGAEDDAGAWRA